MSNNQRTVMVTGGYGGNTRKPYVAVEFGGDPPETILQMSPEEARRLGMNLIACAEASESDAFLVEFVTQELKSDDKHAVILLQAFRKFRNALRGEEEETK